MGSNPIPSSRTSNPSGDGRCFESRWALRRWGSIPHLSANFYIMENLMDAVEVALKLHGTQYDKLYRVVSDMQRELRAARLVVVYGASDDLVEFVGATGSTSRSTG